MREVSPRCTSMYVLLYTKGIISKQGDVATPCCEKKTRKKRKEKEKKKKKYFRRKPFLFCFCFSPMFLVSLAFVRLATEKNNSQKRGGEGNAAHKSISLLKGA